MLWAPLSHVWQWPQTDRICHPVLSARRSFDPVSLFPLPASRRHSLPQVKLRVKGLSLVLCPWSGLCSQLKTLTRAPQSSITRLLLAILEKGLECFLHNTAIWLNQNCLCFSKPVPDRGVHPSIHFHGVLPKQKSTLQILLYWHINAVTSAKEPSSHSEAG